MADNQQLKREVTQEELDAAYAAIATAQGAVSASPATGADAPAADAKAQPAALRDGVGLQIGNDRTNVVFLKKGRIDRSFSINNGFDELDRLFEELGPVVEESRRARTPLYLTVTGKPARFTLIKLPKMPPAQMMKAFKVQMKQLTGEERDEVVHLPLRRGPNAKENQSEYLVASVDKTLVEKTVSQFRKRKVRPAGWDLDFLCYARAASYLWQRENCENSTRFLVHLEWDHCYLLVVSQDGRIIAPRLPMGVQSFMEHLMQARDATVPKSTDSRDWTALPSDPVEVRQRKLMANQAIHDVYVPFAQQIKTQLFAGCNEHGISLPTHFAIVGAGASLFHITESLAHDLNLKPVAIDKWVQPDMLGALGASLSDQRDMRLNFMPRNRGEMLRQLRELFRGAKGKVSLGDLKSKIDVGASWAVAAGAVGAIALVVAAIYPFWDRIRVSKELAKATTELKSLDAEKERIKKSQDREAALDKKMAMVKLIEKNQLHVSRAVQELLAVLPAKVKLQSLSFKDSTFDLKGLAQDEVAVQNFLRSAFTLRYLADPTPVGIKREKSGTEFELTFKFRTNI